MADVPGFSASSAITAARMRVSVSRYSVPSPLLSVRIASVSLLRPPGRLITFNRSRISDARNFSFCESLMARIVARAYTTARRAPIHNLSHRWDGLERRYLEWLWSRPALRGRHREHQALRDVITPLPMRLA